MEYRLKLCQEFLKRGWELTITDGEIYYILGNKEVSVKTEEQAKDALLELYKYWPTDKNTWMDEMLKELKQKPREKWTEDDCEAYYYIQQIKFENGEFNDE